MGVVYKAEDTQLKRIVALKFLPDRVNNDTAAKERFLQEAQAAAALNHPNICTIHGVEDVDGSLFIVMEYVEGGTLREKLPFNKIDDAIRIATQIGEGLHEAHSKGIVHRDIKADNIMLTSKGQAKVMDFGLAKLKGAMKLTKTSSTVGTLGYMAPEQIQGGEVDHRSDIFSFGVLLFEMLTGKLPFRGDHEAAMMYSIVNEQPDPIEKHLPEASSELRHIFNRALEKDPEERYQAVHDMVIDLRRLKKETSRVSREFAASSEPLSSAPREIDASSRIRAWYSVGAVAVLAVAALVFFWPRSAGELNPDMKKTEFRLSLTEIGYAGLSRDGNFLVFPAADANQKWDIYSMHILDQLPKRITSDSTSLPIGWTVGARISPDGRLIAYGRFNKATRVMDCCVVPFAGVTSKVVIDGAGSSRWRPDGGCLGFVVTAKSPFEFWTVSPKGTDRKLMFKDTGGKAGRFSFAWSPDGKSVAWLRTYARDSLDADDYQEIVIHVLTSGQEQQLTFDRKHIDEVWWAANDQILYSTDKAGSTNIWAVPSSGGKPVQITTGEGPDLGITLSYDCKKLVYSRIRTIGHLWRAFTDGSETKQLTLESHWNTRPSFSPDRKHVVFQRKPDEISTISGIYIVDREGQNPRELVPPTAVHQSPIWSPDGKWIAYTSQAISTPADSATLCVIDPNSKAIRRLLINGSPRFWIDPNTLLFRRGAQCWELNLASGVQKPSLEDSTFAVPVMGGKYLCYSDSRALTKGLWITPSQILPSFSHVRPKLLMSPEELGVFNILTAQETSVLLYDDRGTVQKVFFPTGMRERIHGTFPGLNKNSWVSVSYDGKEMVYVQNRLDSKLVMIENVFK